ncbi:hypothetical protein BB341_11680 [Streptomyces clavuligerus]|nr:hypothetical protein BB341_11680 [Streptomyces clavuligerus]
MQYTVMCSLQGQQMSQPQRWRFLSCVTLSPAFSARFSAASTSFFWCLSPRGMAVRLLPPPADERFSNTRSTRTDDARHGQ